MRDALVFNLILGLVAFGCSGDIAGPERFDELVQWRGAAIVGVRPVDAEPHIEAGYQHLAPHADGWEPVGWTIAMHEGPIPTPKRTTCGGQRCPPMVAGLTDRDDRAIHLTWAEGPTRLREVACWELSNAALGGRDQDFPWCAAGG